MEIVYLNTSQFILIFPIVVRTVCTYVCIHYWGVCTIMKFVGPYRTKHVPTLARKLIFKLNFADLSGYFFKMTWRLAINTYPASCVLDACMPTLKGLKKNLGTNLKIVSDHPQKGPS